MGWSKAEQRHVFVVGEGGIKRVEYSVDGGKIKSSEVGEGQVRGSEVGKSDVEGIKVEKSEVENSEMKDSDVGESEMGENVTEESDQLWGLWLDIRNRHNVRF